MACSRELPLSDPGRELLCSPSLGLLVLLGFVLGEVTGEAVAGGSR